MAFRLVILPRELSYHNSLLLIMLNNYFSPVPFGKLIMDANGNFSFRGAVDNFIMKKFKEHKLAYKMGYGSEGMGELVS